MLKKWIAPLHVYDFTEKTLHYLMIMGKLALIRVVLNFFCPIFEELFKLGARL